MKKKIVFLSIFVIILLSGCFLQLPEKVTVKSTPTYNFNIGSFSKSFSEELDIVSLFSSLEEKGTNYTIFDYNPNGKSDYQQLLLKMPIQDIPLDFSDYVNNIGLSQSIEDLSFEKTVEIPEVKFTFTEEFDTSSLHNVIGNLVAVTEGVASEEVSQIPFVGKDYFKMITYKSGILTIIGPFVGKVQLYRNNQVLYELSFNEGNASLDLSGKTIYSDMQIKFPYEAMGQYYLAVQQPTVESASGISIETSINKEIDVDLDFDTMGIGKCKIMDGFLKTDVLIPKNWTGVTISNNVELSGAINSSFSGGEFDLSSVELLNDEVGVNVKTDFLLNDATINFSNNIVLDIAFDVKTFEEIELKLGVEDNAFSISEEYSFPKEFIQYVKEIYLNKSEIIGTYTNTLPEGNNIEIFGKSDFLFLDSEETLYSNVTDKSFVLASSEGERCKVIDESQKLDFIFSLLLPGATKENPDLLNLKKVSSGTTYELKMSLMFELDWTKIVLNKINSDKETGVVGTEFSLASVFSELDKATGTSLSSKISIDSFPLYLYVEKPNISLFDQFNFSADSFIKVGNGTVVGDTVNFSSTPKEITNLKLQSFPNLVFTEDGKTVVTDISKEKYSSFVDLKDIINNSKSENSLCLQYSIGVTMGTDTDGISVQKEDLEIENATTSISIYVAVVIPLKFDLIESEEIDLLKVVGVDLEGGKDLFNREGPTENETLEDILNNIRETSINYQILKSPFYAEPSMNISVEFSPENEIDVGFEEGQINVNPRELLEIYPLQPKVILSIPKSTFYLSREKDFEANVSLKIDADVEIDVFGGQDEKNI